MTYRMSDIDRNNLKWFESDTSCATLKYIWLFFGNLRSLNRMNVTFNYPITAIAGENRSGKTTLLAMAACAFHNNAPGFRYYKRSKNYYTFSDFFIQTQEEQTPEGILIYYGIIYDRWKAREPGLGRQARKKNMGGKWNNYDRRARRNVVYYGIDRVVPPSERSALKSHRNKFIPIEMNHEDIIDIRKIASKIFDIDYSEYNIGMHAKYRLNLVKSGNVKYSGFNMGAGENAVFEILTGMYESGRGSLLVIDEIELGLHEKAQRKFIKELKHICFTRHCQVICSTHSPAILESLPPEGRIYIESSRNKTIVTPGISAEYASGKLSGKHGREMDIFVEDKTAETIMIEYMPLEIRNRVKIIPIGSTEAMLRQFAARYKEKRYNYIIFLDGDCKKNAKKNRRSIKSYLESKPGNNDDIIDTYIDNKLNYLPGEEYPEKWLLQSINNKKCYKYLSDKWGGSEEAIKSILESAIRAGKNEEIYTLSKQTEISEEVVLTDIVRCSKYECKSEVNAVVNIVKEAINEL